MEAELIREAAAASKPAWNKGKMIGSKPPLRIKNVWSIRTKLQVDGRLRDLAMFNLAIDSKLRGCDVVALRVEDIAPHGTALDRATVRQRKTGHPVRFEVTEQTREAVDAYMKETSRKPGDYLFPEPALPGTADHNQAVRPARVVLDSWNWAGRQLFRHAFAKANKGYPDLQTNRQSARRTAVVRPPEDRKHRPIPRNRGGRRAHYC